MRPRNACCVLAMPIVLALSLSACLPVPPPTSDDDCGASGLQTLIGQPVAVLPPVGVWTSLRVVHPGEVVTMDYSAARLTATVDGQDRITALRCG